MHTRSSDYDPMGRLIETERLAIRRVGPEDVEFIIRLLNDPSFLRYIGDRNVRSIEDAERYISSGPVASYERHGFGLYLVELLETGEPIGLSGLLKRDELEDADLGYAFLPQHRKLGYAVEAAAGVMDYARRTLGLGRIVAITLPENAGSIRVLEKVGFRFEKPVRLKADGDELALYASEE